MLNPNRAAKRNRAQQPKLVFFEAPFRPANGANNTGVKIVESANMVDDGPAKAFGIRENFLQRPASTQWIQQQPVDREVATLYIFRGRRCVPHLVGMTAVRINAVRPERSYFRHAPFFDRPVLAPSGDPRRNQHHAEMRSHSKSAREHPQNHVRCRRSCNIKVLGLAAQQKIANASAREIRFVSRRTQRPQYLQSAVELG